MQFINKSMYGKIKHTIRKHVEWAAFRKHVEWAAFRKHVEWAAFRKHVEWAAFRKHVEWAAFRKHVEWAAFWYHSMNVCKDVVKGKKKWRQGLLPMHSPQTTLARPLLARQTFTDHTGLRQSGNK